MADVVAMLLQLYPQLDAYLAQDTVLHPDSYDALTPGDFDIHKAEKATTGGCLNFDKVTNEPNCNPYWKYCSRISLAYLLLFFLFFFLPTLTNTGFLSNPILNKAPVVSIEPNVVVLEAGNSVIF